MILGAFMNDIFEDSLLDDEDLEEEVPEVEVVSTPVPVVSTVSPTFTHQNQQLPVISTDDIATEVARREMELRKLEMAEWAEKKKILKGTPKIKELNRVWKKLRKGYSLVKALKGVVSVATWHKWREEYPEIAAMETQCREDRVDYLQDKIKSIAEQTERTKMGEVSRDKLMIDAYQTEIDRIDRLTANRLEDMKKHSTGVTNLTPIQINFAFRKKKQ